MRILLLNLTRFGDLLQSQAAISGLTAQGHCIGLVCLRNFADTAALLRNVDAIFPLPGEKLLALLDHIWPKAVVELETWIKNIQTEFPFDHVCNLTPTLSARLLGRCLAGERPYTGFAIDPSGFGSNTGNWSGFLQGTASSRGVSPFNIVDLFRRVAGDMGTTPDASLAVPDAAAREKALALLHSHAPEGCKGFIAVQLGASKEHRRWPVDFFAHVGLRLWETEQVCPVLLGTRGEARLAEEYPATAAHPCINLTGKTPLPDLAATLTVCRLLISNDTGTLHLAAGLKTPVLGIFLATAQPWDTGPYLDGCCSLEPDLPCHPCDFTQTCRHDLACARSITPEHVIALTRSFLQYRTWHAVALPQGARVWESHLDTYGFMDLCSLSGHDREMRTMWLREQRHFYRQFFDRDNALPFMPTNPACPLRIPQENIVSLQGELSQILELLDALASQGVFLLAHPAEPASDRFLAIFRRISTTLRQSAYLGAVSMVWHEEVPNADNLAQTLHLATQYRHLLQAFHSRLSMTCP